MSIENNMELCNYTAWKMAMMFDLISGLEMLNKDRKYAADAEKDIVKQAFVDAKMAVALIMADSIRYAHAMEHPDCNKNEGADQ